MVLKRAFSEWKQQIYELTISDLYKNDVEVHLAINHKSQNSSNAEQNAVVNTQQLVHRIETCSQKSSNSRSREVGSLKHNRQVAQTPTPEISNSHNEVEESEEFKRLMAKSSKKGKTKQKKRIPQGSRNLLNVLKEQSKTSEARPHKKK